MLVDYLSPTQSATLTYLRTFVADLWGRGDPLHPTYTLHGPQHLKQVESIIEHILGPDHFLPKRRFTRELLKPEQIFWLLAAAWLHDVGMISSPIDTEKRDADKEGVDLAEWIRERHHTRSSEYVMSHASELHLGADEAAFVATICLGHRKEPLTDNFLFSANFPDTQFLAAVLRVADELDITAARTPPQLLDLVWNDMDSLARWHWIKHWCVPYAEHYHLVQQEPQRRLLLTYHLVVRLPTASFEAPFLESILLPVRRVLRDEWVQLILQRKGLSIAVDSFQTATQFVNRTFADGTTLENRLMASLDLQHVLSRETISALDNMKKRLPPPGVELLRRQCQRLISACDRAPLSVGRVEAALLQFIRSLADLQDLRASDDLVANFKKEARVMIAELHPTVIDGGLARMVGPLESECMTTADLAWRLMAATDSNVAERRSKTNHLLAWRGAEANELAAWLLDLKNGAGPEVREEAASHLAQYATADCYSVVLASSCDPSPGVRAASARGLGRLRGPDTLGRLVEILTNDIDGDVRRAAMEAMSGLISKINVSSPEGATQNVLIVDDDNSVVHPLVDALERQGMHVNVVTTADGLQTILKDVTPDLMLCDLCLGLPPVRVGNWDTLRGLSLAQLVRKDLPDVPIIATSFLEPEEIAVQLLSIRCVYIRKPTTVDRFARTIELLLGERIRRRPPPA